MPDLAAHEGFPGHDWHYKVMTQYREQISPVRWLTPGAVEDSSSMWQDSMAAEGWALYSEGLLGRAAERRAARLLHARGAPVSAARASCTATCACASTPGMHTGRMSFEDAVTLFSEDRRFPARLVSGPEGAEADARSTRAARMPRGAITRYARWPTQAITYRLGKEQILSLRKRGAAAFGAGFSRSASTWNS